MDAESVQLLESLFSRQVPELQYPLAYFMRQLQEKISLAALSKTFSAEQRRRFLLYAEARNPRVSIEPEQQACQGFALPGFFTAEPRPRHTAPRCWNP